MLRWLYAGGLLVALALVLAGFAARSRRQQPVERAADCAALSILMTFGKSFGWNWVAVAGAALGVGSVAAMIYFYRRRISNP